MGTEIWVSGPVIEIGLSGPDGKTEQLQALIDTGASTICIDRRIALRLGLQAVDITSMEVADGTCIPASIYAARLTVPELQFDDFERVAAIEMETPSNRVLLGRSFLRHFITTSNGRDARFHYQRVGPIVYEEWDG